MEHEWTIYLPLKKKMGGQQGSSIQMHGVSWYRRYRVTANSASRTREDAMAAFAKSGRRA